MVETSEERVALTGEIDALVSDDVRRRILAAGGREHIRVVTIDLTAVTFCDSSGLHAIVDAQRTLADRGLQVRLTRAQPHVERILEITGVRERFDPDS